MAPRAPYGVPDDDIVQAFYSIPPWYGLQITYGYSTYCAGKYRMMTYDRPTAFVAKDPVVVRKNMVSALAPRLPLYRHRIFEVQVLRTE